MRGPGMAVGIFDVGGVVGQLFHQVQQIGGLGQGFGEGNTASDMEQWLFEQ